MTNDPLVDLLVPGPSLLERARAIRPWPLASDGRSQLEALLARKAAEPASPVLQQIALFEQYTQVLHTLAGPNPLLLTLDDLQWADGGSLHLLFHLGRRLAGSRILLVGAYRPADVALGDPSPAAVPLMMEGGLDEGLCGAPPKERHPLESIVNELRRTFGDIDVDLEQVEGRPFIDAFLDSEPNGLGEGFRDTLYQRTQGHPLFTVELLRGMEERGDLIQDSEGRWVEGPALDWETLPARVEAVVAERIGRLPQRMRDLLRVASVEGETFTVEVAARVQTTSAREAVHCLSETLDRQHHLVGAHGIRRLGDQRLSRYRFRHILFQKYLYGALDPVERAHLHEQVGLTLETLYPAQQIAEVAVQLARHFEEAGLTDKAIHYLHQAGDRAVQLSAYEEAVLHLSRALALLMTLPDSPERARQELDLRLILGNASIGLGSHTDEAGIAYARARELGRQTGQTAQLCLALGEMAIFHYVRSEHRRAREVAQEALYHGQQAGDPLLIAWSRWHLGFNLFGLGDYAPALEQLEQVVTLHTADPGLRTVLRLPGADAFLSARAYYACCLWCLGYPDQALLQSRQSLAQARELAHPLTSADVLCYGGCLFNAMRRDMPALHECARDLIQIAEKVPGWLAPGLWYTGESEALSGQVDEGIAHIREGMDKQGFVGKLVDIPRALGALAEAQIRAGRPAEGLRILAEALSLVEETDERYGEAELHLLRAECLRVQGHEAESEAGLHTAIEIARRQQARAWELRATTSLARLWQAQGRVGDARQALAEIYDWFAEGFDTPDLQEARRLLDELGRS